MGSPKQKHTVQVVTIGGGSGAPIVVKSLLKAGFFNLSCICASTDSGGRTGMIRTDERDQVIAISDLFRNLLTLIPVEEAGKPSVKAFMELIAFTDGRKRNLGYTLYYGLLEKYQGDFIRVQQHLETLLNIHFLGTAIPVSTSPSNIAFETTSGQHYYGEHLLDHYAMSTDMVTSVQLEPEVEATPAAITAIKKADFIIYCPGSLYGSVIANLLPHGIQTALKRTKATKILITNLISTRNQTHRFTLENYVEIFKTYCDFEQPIDVILAPKMSQQLFEETYPQAVKNYLFEHAHFLGWDKAEFDRVKSSGITVITEDVFTVTPKFNRVRHNPKKLSSIWQQLLTQ